MKSREWVNIGAAFGHFAALLDAPAVQTGWGEPHWEGHQLPGSSPPPALPGITASPAPLLPYVASRWRMVSSEPSWPGLVDGRQAGKVRGLWRRELCFFKRKPDLRSSTSGISPGDHLCACSTESAWVKNPTCSWTLQLSIQCTGWKVYCNLPCTNYLLIDAVPEFLSSSLTVRVKNLPIIAQTHDWMKKEAYSIAPPATWSFLTLQLY